MEKETQEEGFWDKKEEAVNVSQKLSRLQEEVSGFETLKKDLSDIESLSAGEDVSDIISDFEKRLEGLETKAFLSGKYDRGGAILSIYSGAGGQDAQDWVTLLLRMYERYCDIRGFKNKVLEQSYGEGGGPEGRIGTKSVSLEISGDYAYGLLKRETGVHRLVRISPFSAKDLRHTSFALVEVLPEISEEELEIKIKPEDLKVDTYRSSGPGGQYVNKRDSAIRITHLPTGIVVSCQSERLQGLNRDKAMKMLTAKLYQMEAEKKEKELKQIKGEAISASWGNQIRNYVLHPYKLVKDLRTGMESSSPESVLDGDLGAFIEAEIKLE